MAGGTYKHNGVEVQYIQHATVKIKGNGIVIYIDPWAEVLRGDEEKADIIVSTHDHFDHYDVNGINMLTKDDTIIIVPAGVSTKKLKGKEIKEVNVGDSLEIKGAKFEFVPAYNIGKPFHKRGFVRAVVVTISGVGIYHASDTDAIPEMKELKGKVDIALLPIGGTYTMDIPGAVEAVKMIEPKVAIPIHYNYIPKTEANPEEFKKRVESETSTKVVIL